MSELNQVLHIQKSQKVAAEEGKQVDASGHQTEKKGKLFQILNEEIEKLAISSLSKAE